jgi:hypothetical protein
LATPVFAKKSLVDLLLRPSVNVLVKTLLEIFLVLK